jgi:hypothetical protein
MSKFFGAAAVRRIVVIAGAVLVTASPALLAQAADDATPRRPTGFIRRFSIGGRVSSLFTSLMKEGGYSSSTMTPPLQTIVSTLPAARRIGGGATVWFEAHRRFSVGADLLYRRMGYDRTSTWVSGTTTLTSTNEVEKTRAAYWDLPLLARFYAADRQYGRVRAFLTGGGVIRRVSDVRTFTDFANADGTSKTNTTPRTPANRRSTGYVLGAGLQVMDNLGFKFTPEVRFTRWSRRVFSADPTFSPKGQVEFLLGITF